MAAVFIPPSRETSLNMSTRRPLANVPNATNSPHRAGPVPAKRPRSTNAPIDIPYGQPPPKKQVVEGTETDAQSTSQTKVSTVQGTDSKLFTRRSNNTQPSAFEKKLVAARDKDRQPQSKSTRQEKPPAENISIRQWQRHYRKAFPHFVFYFDAIPIEARSKCSRQVIALGAVRIPRETLASSPFDCQGTFSRSTLAPNLFDLVDCLLTTFTARRKVFLASSDPRRYLPPNPP